MLLPPLLLVVTGLLEPLVPDLEPLVDPEDAWLPLVRVVTGAELWLAGADEEAGAPLPEDTCEPLERVLTAAEPE
ncbi:MAG TPA: hypothetical protein VNR66_13640 [Solirubrobacteraceae bacterium]|nr:hypothetical protein [Solirubrobacteraceae bacterium]